MPLRPKSKTSTSPLTFLPLLVRLRIITTLTDPWPLFSQVAAPLWLQELDTYESMLMVYLGIRSKMQFKRAHNKKTWEIVYGLGCHLWEDSGRRWRNGWLNYLEKKETGEKGRMMSTWSCVLTPKGEPVRHISWHHQSSICQWKSINRRIWDYNRKIVWLYVEWSAKCSHQYWKDFEP